MDQTFTNLVYQYGNIGNLKMFIYHKKICDRAKNLQYKNTFKIFKKRDALGGATAKPRYSEGLLCYYDTKKGYSLTLCLCVRLWTTVTVWESCTVTSNHTM